MFNDPMSSQSEIFSEFLAQLPSSLLVVVCGAGLLLLALMIWIGYIKPRQQQRRDRRAAATRAATNPPDPADLPDLDFLLASADEAPDDPDTILLNTGEALRTEPVLSVRRDPSDGTLLVVIDGVGYRSLADAPQVKARFVQVMRDLNAVVGQATAPASDSPSAEPVTPPPTATPPSPQASIPPPPVTPDGAMPGDLTDYKSIQSNVVESGGLFKRPRIETQPVPELDIAAAIEAYLQHKLSYSPEFRGRNIHVMSAPGGGVRIQVDGKTYETVDDVEDEAARAFLVETIQEWQDRQ